MILQDERTGFWCHTLMIDLPEKMRYNAFGKKTFFYLYTLQYISYRCELCLKSKIKHLLNILCIISGIVLGFICIYLYFCTSLLFK